LYKWCYCTNLEFEPEPCYDVLKGSPSIKDAASSHATKISSPFGGSTSVAGRDVSLSATILSSRITFSISALPRPCAPNRHTLALLISGSVMVTRFGGGFGELSIGSERSSAMPSHRMSASEPPVTVQ
uniref:Uncharacterized protein n=1 Tax=Anopheles atroparvus TaxID=41427 RepID=A0AAG5DKN3_ANOAO